MEKRFLYLIYLVYKEMALKKHHKWAIGGFSSIVIIFMITTGILLNGMIVKQKVNYNNLNNKINELQTNTQSQINILSENLISTQTNIEESQKAINLLKASAGEDFSGIIEDVINSVMTITTNSGIGSGFIINEGGYVVTNAHVLADETGHLASNINVITYGGEKIPTEFIGFDGSLDIALLKILGNYDALELADSDKVKQGERVIAIGGPFGLGFSVTDGIVSAIHRKGINGIEAYIQTDAALNPGNSGGPLINKKGEVVGINNFKISDSESLGFALESNYIKDIVNQIAQQELNQTLI